MRIPPVGRRALAVVVVLSALLAGVIAGPASAQTPDDAVVASGEGWTVESAPAGYVVTLRLDKPLPLVSDAPTIVVDGQPVGPARTSDGGRTLTAFTIDERVATARDVTKGWASGSGPKAGEDRTEEATPRGLPLPGNDVLARQLAAIPPSEPVEEPATVGPYAVTEAEYDFGDQAIGLAGYPGTRGEVAGKLYLSAAPGPRPVVVLEHGRHATCGDVEVDEAYGAWPCPADQVVIRSYLGYEGTGRALASHGYDVVSISANAVNATDAELTLDEGAQARGRLVLDTLDMLDRLGSGEVVRFDDRPDTGPAVTRTFDDALARATERADQPAVASGLTAADLVGRFDLTRIGLMGHSRGGEGVVVAAQLNATSGRPYGIRSVLPLAPTDFARRSMSDVTTAVMLPYCDGDVADQQGQRIVDDSRHAFDDDVLRSAVYVMGANHNFFSSVWTPGQYPVGTSDDWTDRDDVSACATSAPTRLSAAEQYQVGVSFMTGFFRLTLGGEEQFRPLVDGTVRPRTVATSFADVRVAATQSRSTTDLVTDFADGPGELSVSGDGEIERCESSGVWASQPCSYASDYQLPHWGQAVLASTVPSRPSTRFVWTAPDDATEPSDAVLSVAVPDDLRDVSDRTQLTLHAVPWDRVVQGTDFSITLRDGAGGSYTVAASALNPFAVNRMPGGSFLLDKLVLQQLTLPLSQVTGVDLSDVREVVIEPLIGADGTASGGVILSDLAFDTPSTGAPAPVERPALSVSPGRVDARDEPWEASIAVVLDQPVARPVVAWANILAAPRQGESPAGLGPSAVTFAPGETCVAVPVYLHGEPSLEGEDLSVVRTAVTTSSVAVVGADGFSTLRVRAPEGGPGMELPFGVQGDVCAEYAASRQSGVLSLSSTDVRPGGTVLATATGFRVGEAVVAGYGSVTLAPVIADEDGRAVFELTVPADAEAGSIPISASGAGSARVQQATVVVSGATPTPEPTASLEPTASPEPTVSAEPTASAAPSVSAGAGAVPTPVAAAGGASLPRTGVDASVWLAVALAAALLTAAGAGVRTRAGSRRR